MKRKALSLLLASTMVLATPLTVFAEEPDVSQEELANEEAEAVAEEVETDNRIIQTEGLMSWQGKPRRRR